MGWTHGLPLLCRIGTTLCLMMLPHVYNVRGDVIAINPDNSTSRFNSMPSNFGTRISSSGLDGYLVMAEPTNGCTLIAPPPVTNKTKGAIFFALIKRNECNFDHKVWNAQESGYKGVIVHNVGSQNILPMSGDDYAKDVGIPSVFVGENDGERLGRDYNYTTGKTVTLTPYISFPPGYYLLPFITVTATCMIFFAIYMIAKYVRDRRRLRRARLSKDHLKKIPTKKFKKGDEYDICAICLDDYETGDKLRILPCNHAFHTKCVDPWLTNNKRTCPVCKRKVVPRGEHDSSDSDTSDDDSDAPTESTPLLNSASGGGGAGGGGGSNEQSPQSSRSATPTRHVDASTAMTPAEDTDEESGGSASTDSYEMGSNQATVAIIGPSGSIQQMRPVTEIQIEHEVLVERPDESSDDEVLMIDNADEDGFVCDDENARLQKV